MTNKDDRFSSGGDIAGTLVFAIEGAVAAVHGNLDLMGLMVLAFATALGGGIIRDLLIGDVPPASLRDWRYGATAFAGAAIVFFLHRPVERHDRRNCDPGCGGFVAVRDGEDPEGACVSNASAGGSAPGTFTGVGGGTVRDVLLAQVPTVLRSDVYATAALAGAILMTVAYRAGLPQMWAATVGGLLCFSLRVVSVWQHWSLPRVLGE